MSGHESDVISRGTIPQAYSTVTRSCSDVIRVWVKLDTLKKNFQKKIKVRVELLLRQHQRNDQQKASMAGNDP